MFLLPCLVVLVKASCRRFPGRCALPRIYDVIIFRALRSCRPLSRQGPHEDPNSQARPVSLIFKRELLKRVPLSFPTIWKMMREGRFPRARIIGGKSAWLESEIDQFLTDLPVRPYKE